MKKIGAIFILFALILACSKPIKPEVPAVETPPPYDPYILLRLKFDENQSFKIHTYSTQNLSKTIMGQKQQSQIINNMTYLIEIPTITVLEDGTHYLLKITPLKAFFKEVNPNDAFEYNSDTKEMNVRIELLEYAAMINENYTVIINDRGEILEIKEVENFLNNIFKKINANEKTRTFIRAHWNPVTIHETVSEFLPHFPVEKVQESDFWHNTIEVFKYYPLIIFNHYQLTKRENGIAKINLQSEITPWTAKESVGKKGPLEIKYDLNYKLSGDQKLSYAIEESNGFIAFYSLFQALKGTVQPVTGPDSGTISEDLIWPMEIEKTVNIIWEK